MADYSHLGEYVAEQLQKTCDKLYSLEEEI